MPIPLLWAAVVATVSAVGYATKKIMDDDDSSCDNDSSYEEERRRQEKAKRKARKAEKARKIKLLEIDFANTGEKYRHDITCALKNLVSLHFEKNPGFCRTLGDGFQAGPDQQVSWADKHCTPETKKNLSFLLKNYAVGIFPSAHFEKISETIDASTSAINDLKHKRLALEKMKCQLKKVAN